MTILDTDVLIDHFRGLASATDYLKSLPRGERATTDVTIMEGCRGVAKQDELSTIERFLIRPPYR